MESRRLTKLASGCIANHGYDPNYFGLLFAVEDKHFWFCTRNRVIAALVHRIAATPQSGHRILEVGCGTGNVLRILENGFPQGTVVGMDLFAEGLQYARRRTSCDLVQGDVHKLPFCSRFDLIGLFDVLEHLPDDRRVLRDLHSILKPRGVLILTVPAHQSLWSYFDEISHHRRRYGPSELESKLISTGYSVEYLTLFMASVFPIVWVKRRSMRIDRDLDRKASRMHHMALAELRIVPVVNELLTLLLAQEAWLISHHGRLPIGTSLLAVARKRPNDQLATELPDV